MSSNTGIIVQVIGPVVDVDFSASTLPKIYEALEIQFNVNGNYQGKTVGSLDEDPVFDVKAYTVVNANIALHRQDDRWSIGLYARNLFNENYYTATDILTDTSIRVPGMVRTYGLVASFKY